MDLKAFAGHLEHRRQLPSKALQRILASVQYAETKAVARGIRIQMGKLQEWATAQRRAGGEKLYRWINPRAVTSSFETVGGKLASDPDFNLPAKQATWSSTWRELRGHPPAQELPHMRDDYIKADIEEALAQLRIQQRREGNKLEIPTAPEARASLRGMR